MIFNSHSDLEGRHAFLSASKYHWVNYDDEKLAISFGNAMAAHQGTILHEFAAQAIRLGIKLPRTSKTMNMYVNDAIGFRMAVEQCLFYSDNAFGTADTISFRDNFLRIHDLKTGVTPASMKQLEVYAAFFCLEYNIKPATIQIELRIYQNDQMISHVPDLEDIMQIMQKTIAADHLITEMKMEALS